MSTVAEYDFTAGGWKFTSNMHMGVNMDAGVRVWGVTMITVRCCSGSRMPMHPIR